MEIQLVASISSLDDVVVVGYGTAKQKDVTGAISSLGGEAIENIPVSTADKAIQGRIAGVQVVRNGGAPGASTSIRIRGTGTVNNADPLYIIDGVPTSSITGINPIDIKSIEVLKDASASAIYGTRAANGVVIVSALGNETSNTEVYSSLPADFSVEIPGMISVAAINNTGDLSSFSNYGNSATIAAPGGQVGENNPQDILSTVPGDNYEYLRGTSMSSPIVAGAAALLLAQDPTLTPSQIKELLLDQANELKGLEDKISGGKYLDLYSSLYFVQNIDVVAAINSAYISDPKGFSNINGESPVTVSAYEVGKKTILDSIKDYDGNLHAGDNL